MGGDTVSLLMTVAITLALFSVHLPGFICFTHIQVRCEDVAYADKYSHSAGKYNLTKLEDEMKELIYPPSVQCTVQYALPPPDRSWGKAQDIDFIIQGTSKGYLSFPVEVVEVKGE